MHGPGGRPALLSIALFFGLAALMALAVRSCIRTVVEAPGTGVRAVGKALTETVEDVTRIFDEYANLKPEIRVNQTIIHGQSSPILELAVIQKEFWHDFTWFHRWLGSTKSLQISGKYLAKAGFDLSEPFTVTINEETGEVTAELPSPRLLSVERTGEIVFKNDSGYWNRVKDEDRQSALNQAEASARQEIVKSEILQEAEKEALRRLQELSDKNKQQMSIHFRENKSPFP